MILWNYNLSFANCYYISHYFKILHLFLHVLYMFNIHISKTESVLFYYWEIIKNMEMTAVTGVTEESLLLSAFYPSQANSTLHMGRTLQIHRFFKKSILLRKKFKYQYLGRIFTYYFTQEYKMVENIRFRIIVMPGL